MMNLKRKISLTILPGILIYFLSCQQNNQPQPTPQNNGGNGNTQGTISAQQQQILGNWILRRSEHYSQNIVNGIIKDSLIMYENFYSPSTCYINFTATQTTFDPSLFVANGSLGCSPMSLTWKIPSANQINIHSTIYNIEFLSNDSLVLSSGGSPGNSGRLYLNKTTHSCGLNLMEQIIAKNWTLYKYEVLFQNSNSTAINLSDNGVFLNQWYVGGYGYKVSGFSTIGWISWQVVENRLSLDGSHFKIDTLNNSKLVITSFDVLGTGQRERYYFH